MRRVLVVGWGDVARRTLPLLHQWATVGALSRSVETDSVTSFYQPMFSALPLDLDAAKWNDGQKRFIAQPFDAVLWTAPPAVQTDTTLLHISRLERWLTQWEQCNHAAHTPRHWLYIGTSGVYGNRQGDWVDEHTPTQPESAPAKARAHDEQVWQAFGQRHHVNTMILRAPGIYALERLPLAPVLAGHPVMRADEDSYSNHIHADDLAGLAAHLLKNGFDGAQVLNACDDQPLLMGQWLNAVAHVLGMSQLDTVSRAQMAKIAAPSRWRFMRESRRISNQAMKRRNYVLKHPTALAFLTQHADDIREWARQRHPQYFAATP